MNPFLESAVASPMPVPDRIRAPVARSASHDWRRVAGGVALAAGLTLSPALCAADQGGAMSPTVVNVNIATLAELQTIRGVGPKTAQRIVQERERAGPFISFQDFTERIRGIGPKRAAAMRAAGVGVSSSPPRVPHP